VSFASLLVHPLLIWSPVVPDPNDVDDYGQPILVDPTSVAVRGMVQPKTAKEAAATHQAGVEVSTHVIFLLPQPIAQGAWITDDPANGRRFDITGIRSFEFGSAPHLEVDAVLVGSTEGPAIGS